MYRIWFSHDVLDLTSCKLAKASNYHVPEEPMLPFPMNISLELKYTYPVHDIQDRRSLQQVLRFSKQETALTPN